MSTWIKRLGSLLLILSSTQLAAEPSLWVASKAQQRLYLFGSIHLGSEQFYPLPAAFIDAFKHSQQLIIETDITKLSASDQQMLNTRTLQPANRSLNDDLSPHYQQLLKQRSQQLGISETLFSNMRAWYAAIVLSQLQMQALGFKPELGLDLHFIEQAKQRYKPIIALETFEQQLEALSSLESIQIPLLQQTLDEFEQVPQMFNQLVEYWNKGDNQQLFALLGEDPMFQQEAEMVINKLLYQRNQQWLQQLTELNNTSFVVVGAMHLYGEQGLLSNLEQQGYVIREVDPNTD
ncbi:MULTISPECIES: TraB/GumN family protein [unclassified Agarivorans]|uniref:TraB/GumN family protein n=1 Tax=unclassified Agarivorans TaxID=2636026 RepID=UPI003D7DED55